MESYTESRPPTSAGPNGSSDPSEVSMRRQVSTPGTASFLWTHVVAPAVRLGGIAIALSLAGPAEAAERWVGIGPTTGARWFASRFELQSEIAVGARVTIGVSDRLAISIDGGHSNPSRRSSGVSSSYGEIRALASYRFLPGPLRPYLLTGLGGQFFNFHDAPGAAGVCVAGGLGVEYEAAEEWALFGEVSVDAFRARFQTFSETGQVIDSSEMRTYGTGIATVGLQYRF